MKKLGFFFLLLLVCQSCIIICKGGKDKIVEKSNYEKVSGRGQIVEKEMTLRETWENWWKSVPTGQSRSKKSSAGF